MSNTEPDEWIAGNQQYMVTELNRIRRLFLKKISSSTSHSPFGSLNHIQELLHLKTEEDEGETGLKTPLTQDNPSALFILCERFGLSSFERDILLLCAGIELDSTFSSLCAAVQEDPARSFPTFSLALAVFPEAHWSALSPAAPLRYWRMIEGGSGSSLTTGQIRIDERILHYLTGIQYLDERLRGYASPSVSDITIKDLVPSHQAIAYKIMDIWSDLLPGQRWPVIQLCGSDAASKQEIADAACEYYGLSLLSVPSHFLPANPAELEALTRLCERESILSTGSLCLICDDIDTSDASRMKVITWFMQSLKTPLVVSTREPVPAEPGTDICIVVHGPEAGEQMDLWHGALEGVADISDHSVGELVSQFNMNSRAIHRIGNLYRARYDQSDITKKPRDNTRSTLLWNACREHTRTHLSNLAQNITPSAVWLDLILPDSQKVILKEIATQVRQRMTVYRTWGFAEKSARGLGISALFSGASGTGKTMAAEVLANELSLDLYRIDLSQVVSKFIGETEKNLRQLFDAAEEGGAILLFDEADALFGRRSEVKDSHDRYANIEISYLLQRMEEYRGLAILTTNMKEALDPAFLRRIRFIVQFPFPDSRQRTLIWKQVFPEKTPRIGLDYTKLARLNIAGGNIRNIALSAAFIAAGDGGVVEMKHLLHAARSEYAKMDRTLMDAEVGGWV